MLLVHIALALALAQLPQPVPAPGFQGVGQKQPPQASGISEWENPSCTPAAACLANVKPAGTSQTYTGSGGTQCASDPVSGTGGCTTKAANFPVISVQGVRVMSAAALSNGLTYSTVTSTHWTVDGTTTVGAASASCPAGPISPNPLMALVTPDANGDGIRQAYATGTARGIWLSYAVGGSACNVTLADNANAHARVIALTATPTFYSDATAGDAGISVVKSASGGCAAFCADNGMSNATLAAPIAEQFNATAGSVFSASADVLSGNSTLKNPAQWYKGVTVYKSTALTGNDYLFGLGTAGSTNNAWLSGRYAAVSGSDGLINMLDMGPNAIPAGTNNVIMGVVAGRPSVWINDVKVNYTPLPFPANGTLLPSLTNGSGMLNTLSGLTENTGMNGVPGTLVGTYNVGAAPLGVAFDGTNIWVANDGGANVTKLLASTGALVGTYTTGASPLGVAFDGTNIWVTNFADNTVTKLLASTGALVGTYNVGTHSYGVAFDGTNIWVTNYGSNNVTKLLATAGSLNGEVLKTCEGPTFSSVDRCLHQVP